MLMMIMKCQKMDGLKVLFGIFHACDDSDFHAM